MFNNTVQSMSYFMLANNPMVYNMSYTMSNHIITILTSFIMTIVLCVKQSWKKILPTKYTTTMLICEWDGSKIIYGSKGIEIAYYIKNKISNQIDTMQIDKSISIPITCKTIVNVKEINDDRMDCFFPKRTPDIHVSPITSVIRINAPIDFGDGIFGDITLYTDDKNGITFHKYFKIIIEFYTRHKSIFENKFDKHDLKKKIDNLLDEIVTEHYKHLLEYPRIVMGDELVSYPGDNQVNRCSNFAYTKIYDVDGNQTFDTMFFKQKHTIMNDITLLNNVDLYKKFGCKRKLTYLLYGLPGTGKTAFVSALANYTHRNILYIPLNRIKTNEQLMAALYDSRIEKKIFDNDKIIIFLDEIDKYNKKFTGDNTNKTKNIDDKSIININFDSNDDGFVPFNQSNQSKPRSTNSDPLNEGMLLNMLDGLFNQNGLIIIATANSLDNINPAFYRDGRLKLTTMTYMGRNEIKEMIEYFYNTKITDEQLEQIRNDEQIQNLTLKRTVFDYFINKRSIDDLIIAINLLDNPQ